jgi:hypothetical protein
MTRYLLPCSCGKSVEVEVGQAGGKTVCICGSALEVPTLRKLRHLPQAKPTQTAGVRRTWSARKGLITASLALMTLFLTIAAYIRFTEPVVSQFNPSTYLRDVERRLESPAVAWQWWNTYYRPMAEHGFPTFRAQDEAVIQYQINQRRFLQGVMLTVAGVWAVVALAAYFWPAARQPVRRRK